VQYFATNNITIRQINSGSGAHFVALDCNLNVWSWGDNTNGQVGNNTSGNVVITPTQVLAGSVVGAHFKSTGGFLTNAKVVYAGTSNSYAILDDGTLAAWGANTGNQAGQLGNGSSTANSSTPVLVIDGSTNLPLKGVTEVFAGDNVTYALVDPTNSGLGTVYSWGYGATGTLGRDATTATNSNNFGTVVQDSYARPVRFADGSTLSNIVSISAGDVFGIALDNQGYVWTWGQGAWANSTGKLL
jgi:alpha-tubulin suppressor-like RCC1 family protein